MSTTSEETKPVATLLLKNIKASGAIRVHGRSGKKYSFTRSPLHKKHVLEFTSVERFMQVESDIRGIRQNQHEIITLLGPVDPVLNAQEAVEALVGSSRKVPIHRRKEALEKLGERIRVALEMISLVESRQEEDPVSETPEPAKDPEPVNPRDERKDNWRDADTNKKLELEKPIVVPESTLPESQPTVSESGQYTHAQLMTMPWNDFKQMATERGVHAGKLGRDKLAAAFTEAQTAGFPGRGQ